MTVSTPAKAPKAKALKAAGPASTAVAVRKPMNVVSIQAAIAAQTAGIAGRINASTGNKIRATQDKKFILPNGEKVAGPLELVVVDFQTVHNFYAGPFDKDNVAPPDCFAVGSDPKNLAPSANVPNKQADNCQVCPMNQWGSDGTGKACKNGRMLAVLPPDADDDTELWILQPSATAIKGFDGFVAGVARTMQTPPIGVIVKVGFDENVTFAKMEFSDPVPNPRINEMFGRQAEAKELFEAVRDVSGWKPIGAPVGKKAVAKQAGVRR